MPSYIEERARGIIDATREDVMEQQQATIAELESGIRQLRRDARRSVGEARKAASAQIQESHAARDAAGAQAVQAIAERNSAVAEAAALRNLVEQLKAETTSLAGEVDFALAAAAAAQREADAVHGEAERLKEERDDAQLLVKGLREQIHVLKRRPQVTSAAVQHPPVEAVAGASAPSRADGVADGW
jgi:uncharacterized coiled-coil DUF342 family protein